MKSDNLKALARRVKGKHSLTFKSISLASLRKIYREEGIKIDLWHYKLRKVRGAYMVIDGDPYVLINANIKPKEPRIFTMAHELKHHYIDRNLAEQGILGCNTEVSWSNGPAIEIGAEIFAAEFVYPEDEFLDLVNQMGLTNGHCTAEDVVHLKRECPAPVSYTFLKKRLEWFSIIDRGAFSGFKFQKLEESMFGVPFYRRRKASNHLH